MLFPAKALLKAGFTAVTACSFLMLSSISADMPPSFVCAAAGSDMAASKKPDTMKVFVLFIFIRFNIWLQR